MLPTVSQFLRSQFGLDDDAQQQAAPPDEIGAPVTPVQSSEWDTTPTFGANTSWSTPVQQPPAATPEPQYDYQISAGGPPTPNGQWEPVSNLTQSQYPVANGGISRDIPPDMQVLAEDSVSAPVPQVAQVAQQREPDQISRYVPSYAPQAAAAADRYRPQVQAFPEEYGPITPVVDSGVTTGDLSPALRTRQPGRIYTPTTDTPLPPMVQPDTESAIRAQVQPAIPTTVNPTPRAAGAGQADYMPPDPNAERPAGIPQLPGVAGRMLSEEARQTVGSGSPVSPFTLLNAFAELPFDVYQMARDQALTEAQRGMGGTDPLAPFRHLGIALPDAETINPNHRPADVVLAGLLLSGVIPDPSDPLVAMAFRAGGRAVRGVSNAVLNIPSEGVAARTAESMANNPLTGVHAPDVRTPSLVDGIVEQSRGAAGRVGEALRSAPEPQGVMHLGSGFVPGEGRRMYHGTGDVFPHPDPEKFDPNGLFGPGYYLTDDPRIAGGVGEARTWGINPETGSTINPDGSTYMTGDASNLLRAGYAQNRAIKNLTMEQAREVVDGLLDQAFQQRGYYSMNTLGMLMDLSADLSSGRIKNTPGATPAWVIERTRAILGIDNPAADRMVTEAAGRIAPGANVRAVDIPSGLNLLDADVPAQPRDLSRIVDQVKAYYGEEKANRFRADVMLDDSGVAVQPTGERIWRSLRVILGEPFTFNGKMVQPDSATTTREVNQILSIAGFDGITYAGGQRIPMKDKFGQPIDHQAVMVFGESLPKIRNAFSGEVGGSGFVPGMSDLRNAAQGGVIGAASEATSDEDLTPQERMARIGAGAVLGVAAGRAARGRGGRSLGSGFIPTHADEMRAHVIPPHIVDSLDFPVRIPEDAGAISAIRAIGGDIDPERGVTINVTRAQGPQSAGGVATRGGVFYEAVPEGGRSSYVNSTDDPTRVGGSQVIPATPTRFRSPLIVNGPPGEASGFDEAVRQMGATVPHPPSRILGYETRLRDAERQLADVQARGEAGTAYLPAAQQYVEQARAELEAVRNGTMSFTASDIARAISEARRAGPEGSQQRAEALKEVVRRFGGDPDAIDPLLAIRGADASESAWAIRENILAAHARRNGYDGVVTVQRTAPTAEEIHAHPSVKAAHAAVVAAGDEAERAADRLQAAADAAIPMQWRRPEGEEFGAWFNRVVAGRENEYQAALNATEHHPSVVAARDEADRAALAYERASAAWEQARRKASEELRGGKITELVDVREGRNPTPGAPNPRIAEAEAALNDARARVDAAKAEASAATGRAEYEMAVARTVTARRDAENALRALQEARKTPHVGEPGYTLREDIPRRPEAPPETPGPTPPRTVDDTPRSVSLNATLGMTPNGGSGTVRRGGAPMESKPFWRMTEDEAVRWYEGQAGILTEDVTPRPHKTVTTPQELQETLAYYQQQGIPVYQRSSGNIRGDIKRGYSMNYQTGRPEGGISANEFDPLLNDRGNIVNLIHAQDFYTHNVSGGKTPRIYLLTGEAVGRGGDNEHVLAPASIRVLGEIKPGKELTALGAIAARVREKRARQVWPWFEHRNAIRDALERGDDVPPEVVAQYPELVRDFPDKATPRGEPPALGTTGISPSIGSRILGDVSNSLSGGVFGAGAGYALPADSEEERRRNALALAAGGMVGAPLVGRMLPRAEGALATPGLTPNRKPGGPFDAPNRPRSLNDPKVVEPTLPGMEPLRDAAPPRPIGEVADDLALTAEQRTAQANRALQETAPNALNWYQRRAEANKQRIARSGREPLSPLQWMRSLIGNVGYSSMLGPGTFSVNMAVGAGEPLWSMPREFIRQGVRAIQTRNLSALREHGEMQWGAMYGMTRVGEAVMDALRGRGRYAANPNFPTLSQQTVNPIGQAIAQVIEAPGRFWSGMPDAIFGTIAQHAGEAREAAQIATNKGLKGDAWKQEVARLLEDSRAVARGELPTGPEVQQVVDAGAAYATRQTYRDELGSIGKQVEKVAKLGNAPVLGNWAAPFFKTIWTAGVRQAEKTPLGAAMNTFPSRLDRVYDPLVGGAVVLGMGSYAANGGVTGSGPADPKERELLRESGWQPYSTYVKMPGQDGMYIPNRMFGIFEGVLNTVGETHDAFAYQKPDADSRAKFDDTMRRTGQLIRQNPYAFQGLVSILDAYSSGPIATASDQAARMTPFGSAARTVGQMTDTHERTTDRGKGVDPADEFVQRWQQQTGQRSGLPVAQDAFGQPRENQRQGVRALLPNMPRVKDAPEARIFREARINIGNPRPEIRLNDDPDMPPVPLKPSERRLWDQKRGDVLLQVARNLAGNPNWDRAPIERRQEILRDWMKTAADAADQFLKAEIGNQELNTRVRKAAEQKKKAS